LKQVAHLSHLAVSPVSVVEKFSAIGGVGGGEIRHRVHLPP
jgi:hypothetical protein